MLKALVKNPTLLKLIKIPLNVLLPNTKAWSLNCWHGVNNGRSICVDVICTWILLIMNHLNESGQLFKGWCSLDLHFSAVTTILVTKRTVDSNYPPSDVISKAKVRDIKIWSYEKLLRFLTNLCGSLVSTSLNADSTSSASNTMNTTTNTTAVSNNTRITNSRDSLHQNQHFEIFWRGAVIWLHWHWC